MTEEKQKREGIQQVSVRGESGQLWAKHRRELIAAIDDVIKGLLSVPIDPKKGTTVGEEVQELASIGLDSVKARLKRGIVQNEKDEAEIKLIYNKTEHERVMKDKTRAEIRKLDAESEKMELDNVVQSARLKLKLTKAMIAGRPGEEAILFGKKIDTYLEALEELASSE